MAVAFHAAQVLRQVYDQEIFPKAARKHGWKQ
jgi:hypothetical protein